MGVSHRLTGQDTVFVWYTYNRDTFSASSVGNYDSHNGSVAWTRIYSQSLRSNLSGGASMVTQEFSGGSQSRWVYTSLASVNWIKGPDALTLSYSGGVYPSYVASAGALFSNLVAVTGTHRFSEYVAGGVGANYSSNRSVQSSGPEPELSLESKSANAWMSYRITQSTILALAYNWGLFSGNYFDPNQTNSGLRS